MVEDIIINKVRKQLEKFFLMKNKFQLKGDSYDLILFFRQDSSSTDADFGLILSANIFDAQGQRDLIRELLFLLKDNLDAVCYNAISTIKFMHSNHSLVKKLQLLYTYTAADMFEVNNLLLEGLEINNAVLIKSRILQELVPGRILVLEINNKAGSTSRLTVQILRVEKNFTVLCFKAKMLGTTENMSAGSTFSMVRDSEKYLSDNNYLLSINLDDITNVQAAY